MTEDTIEQHNKEKTVEEQAMDLLKDKWSHLFTFGYPSKPYPTNFENDLNCVMLGLLKANVEEERKQAKLEVLNELRTYFDVSKLDDREQRHHIRFTSIIVDMMAKIKANK